MKKQRAARSAKRVLNNPNSSLAFPKADDRESTRAYLARVNEELGIPNPNFIIGTPNDSWDTLNRFAGILYGCGFEIYVGYNPETASFFVKADLPRE